MILFFNTLDNKIIAVDSQTEPEYEVIQKLCWLFGDAKVLQGQSLDGVFIGPRKEMITPWSTNAVEITQNMGISNIRRIEQFRAAETDNPLYDPMLEALYNQLSQDIFTVNRLPEPMEYVDNIYDYNKHHGLALNEDEIAYLQQISLNIERKLTDSEVYGFAQVNSEHCRHKIFNGTFIIDGKAMPETLFGMIKKTSEKHPNRLVSAYKDNVAFIEGPAALQFAPEQQDKASYFCLKPVQTVISLKAETHNFPTTVEPFNGASTGTGGEIRDRMAGGKGSIPLVGTAVYMTSYPRTGDHRDWERNVAPRKWLYHNPEEILIKASNGASDFGNKFGQPLINGSLLTFEHKEGMHYGYDKVIMLAGGVGTGIASQSKKDSPLPGDRIVVLGGDNYRIGMGGGAVSSVDTGQYSNSIELNAVQRANPEMQKRVSNVVRAMVENDSNPIRSIHDHGAGGHLNSLSELVEESGGIVHTDKLPVGDPTLSDKEIAGNESQERMGLVIDPQHLDFLQAVADRERAPMYNVGLATGDGKFQFRRNKDICTIDLKLEHLFGKPPKTVLTDRNITPHYEELTIDDDNIHCYLQQVLQLEAVACKDWLTNKVDRSVTGRVATQQTIGPVQLPLNNLGVVSIDYQGIKGIATAIGHAPVAGLIDSRIGSRLAVAEALTNIIWAPIEGGLKGVSLSANWMWPAKNEGENSRLFKAVKALSDFCIEIGINVPTGKDSLSMTQKYPDGSKVLSPGTVIVTAVGEVSNIQRTVNPLLKPEHNSRLLYIDMSGDEFKLGGSSLAQSQGKIGMDAPDVLDAEYFASVFETIQVLINQSLILAGHDVSAGGLITTLLEMNFANCEYGMKVNTDHWKSIPLTRLLFSEKPAIVIQVRDDGMSEAILESCRIHYVEIGHLEAKRFITIQHGDTKQIFDIDVLRDTWFRSSYLLDRRQSGEKLALERFQNYKKHDLVFSFNSSFTGTYAQYSINPERTQSSGIRAAIIREKGVNGDREMAYALYLAGFDVKDVHMTDLISGKEDLSDVQMIVFVGGFSNSDVLGSAKGWAGAFLYNPSAKAALDAFYERNDTLSLGVCNGCQLMVELNLIYPGHPEKVRMLHNDSGKFESAFLNVEIPENDSIMLGSMAGKRLGVWVAHGEGKFSFPCYRDNYNIVMYYGQEQYPGNPNGSDWAAAAISSNNGRHLAMMPHLERSFLPWQWAYYHEGRNGDQVSPWIEAFVNARNWIAAQKSQSDSEKE